MSQEAITCINIRIPYEVKRRMRIVCANRNKSLTEYLIDLIVRDIEHAEAFNKDQFQLHS